MTKARDLANASTALSAVSATELGYLDGVTSAVQTQLDNKVDETGGSVISANSSGNALEIRQTGAGNALVIEDETNPDSSPVVVNTSGQVFVGKTTANALPNYNRAIQNEGTGASTVGFSTIRNSNDASAPAFEFGKSRGTSIGGVTAVTSGDSLGLLNFGGADGVSMVPNVAQIVANVDGTVSTGVIPSRISFHTVPVSGAGIFERMRIDNAGNVGIGTTSPTAKLDVNGPVKSDNVVGANLLANGAFDIWQRGVGPFTSNVVYTTDRWFIYSSTGYSLAQETSVIPTGATNAVRITGSGAANFANLQQSLEQSEVEKLAGKTVTFSAYLRANATYNGGFALQINWSTTGNSQTPTWANLAQTVHVPSTTAYTRVSVTATVPTNAKGLSFMIAQTQGLASGSVYYMALAKAEIGTLATEFVRLGNSYQADLATCQRYYYRFGGDQTYQLLSQGIGFSTTRCYVPIKFPATMRVVPTSIDFSTLAVQRDPSQSIYAVTSLANLNGNGSGKDVFGLDVTVGSAVLTAGTPYCLMANGSTSAYLGFSAEL